LSNLKELKFCKKDFLKLASYFMNICIVTETYPPEINGVAKTLHTIAKGLKELGHKITIIRPHQKGQPKQSNDTEETIVPSLPIPGYKGLHFGLPCRARLRSIWKKARPDIIYVATEGPLGLSAINVASKMQIAVTSGFHTNFHKYMRHYRLPGMAKLAERFLRKTHNQTLRTFAPTKEVIQQLNSMGVHNTRLLSRGVDTQVFNPKKRDAKLRQSWGAQSDEDCVALFVSRIAAEKNIPLAIQGFEKIQTIKPNAKCVFVGDGPERERLQKKYPSFQFAGMQTGEALSKYYASGDLFIFPSLTETFGNVVTEAMASGLIPIAFDYAAPKQFIQQGANGFLANYEDEEDFLKQINRAFELEHLWPEIRLSARQTSEALNWNTIITQFAEELKIAFEENKTQF
jgi:glycosyltransferase involved in cell wall biosynthesis